MARRRARTRRRTRENIRGISLFAVGLLILVPIAGGAMYWALTRPTIDKTSGCLQSGYPSVTVILVDATDALTPVQGAALQNVLERFRDAIPKYGRLEVYKLEPVTAKPLQPIFSGCNPGSAKDVTSSLTGNEKLAQLHWEREFGSKVDETKSELLTMQPQETSPIFEAIQSVAVTSFGNDKAAIATSKTLVLVSDFIQNVPALNLYKGVPQYSTFKGSQYYRQIHATLNDTDVYMYWIPRTTRYDVQTVKLRDFWRSYIADVGGNSKEWSALQ